MNFTDFSQRISKIKKLPLPGVYSHHKMAPEERVQAVNNIDIPKKKPKKAGVMALFYPDKNQNTTLALILRRTYKGVHSNQIGFPGGKSEKEDTSIEATALRETFEEIGAAIEHIEVVSALTSLYIPPSNFMVFPFIGLYDKQADFTLQASEVEELIEVSYKDLMDDTNIITHKVHTFYAKDWEVPAFKLNGYVVWGATAMMLSEVKELLKQGL